jgi:hypothetical protein
MVLVSGERILSIQLSPQLVQDIQCLGVNGMDSTRAEIAQEAVDLFERLGDIIITVMINYGEVFLGVCVIEVQLALVSFCIYRRRGK